MKNHLTVLRGGQTVGMPTHVKSYTQRRTSPVTARLGRAHVRESHSCFACVGPVMGVSFRRSAMSAQPHIKSAATPDVRLLDEFSISLAKLKVLSTIFRSSDLTDGVDEDVLTGLEYLLDGMIHEFEGIFRQLEG